MANIHINKHIIQQEMPDAPQTFPECHSAGEPADALPAPRLCYNIVVYQTIS